MQSGEGPAASRPFSFRDHAAFLALLAAVMPLTAAFCWQPVIASLGDDSVSYLTLARHFIGDPLVAPWAKYHGHFPPLFPLLLMATGGARSHLAAHLTVGACAVAALVFAYRHAALRLGSARAAAAVAFLFILTPGAWVGMSGILSEPLFLALSLAALVFHARRVDAHASPGALLAFGALLAAVCLTRVAGVALVAAYAVHVGVGAMSRRRLPAASAWIPVVVPIAFTLAWKALRPEPDVDNYALTLRQVLERWAGDPGVVRASWDSLSGGWIATFAGDSEGGALMAGIAGAVAALGVAGAILGARRNRLDAWYVLASLAMLFAWVFPEPIARRLLYPLLPLLLVHAAEAVRAACAMLGAGRYERLALPALAAIVAAMVLPASILVMQKSRERADLFPGSAYSYSAITDYYTTVNVPRARVIAGEHAAVLAGLEALDRATPPGARVMWMRPEYVAVLGRRDAAAWYLSWDRPTLAREIRRSGAAYLVVSKLYKNDLAGRSGDAFESILVPRPAWLRPLLAVANPADKSIELVLLEVDRDALERALAAP